MRQVMFAFSGIWTKTAWLPSMMLVGLLVARAVEARADGPTDAEVAGNAAARRVYESPLPEGEPDYRGYFEAGVNKVAVDARGAAKLSRLSREYRVADQAMSDLTLWRWTGRQKYLDRADQAFRAIVDAWTEAHGKGRKLVDQGSFFLPYPFLASFNGLDAARRVDEALRKNVQEMVTDAFVVLQHGDLNQSAIRLLGQTLAAKTFPDLPASAQLRQWIPLVWNDWYSQRDTTENAPNYNGLFLISVLLQADLTGIDRQLLDPSVRAMFERYRDEVSPGGFIPGYGDSGELSSWPMFVAVFERCATLYDDPTFRWAALRTFAAGSRYDPPTSEFDIGALDMLQFADEWRDVNIKPTPPNIGTQLLTRREPNDPHALDSMVLANCRQSGTPWAFCELYAQHSSQAHPDWGGGHGHPDWGSLAYFEVDNVPLLHSLGYDNRLPSQQNLLLVLREDEPFPHRDEPFEPNRWYEAVLPLNGMPPPSNDAGDADRRIIKSMNFRQEGEKPLDLAVGSLRLVGSSGQRIIDPMDHNDGWKLSGGGAVTTVEGNTPGTRALQVRTLGHDPNGGKPTTFFIRDGLHIDVRLKDFDEIRFFWRMSDDNDGFVRPLVLRLNENFSFMVPFEQLQAVTSSASVQSHGTDHLAEASFGRWFTPDSTWTRRIVLTTEGVMVVRDQLIPGPRAVQMAGGPIWNLFAPPDRGDNWFDAAGDKMYGAEHKRLLVYFAPATDQTLGVKDAEFWNHYHPYTVCARRHLTPGKPEIFTTILIPHGEDPDEAKSIASGIHIDGGTIWVHVPQKQTVLRIHPEQPWSVER